MLYVIGKRRAAEFKPVVEVLVFIDPARSPDVTERLLPFTHWLQDPFSAIGSNPAAPLTEDEIRVARKLAEEPR